MRRERGRGSEVAHGGGVGGVGGGGGVPVAVDAEHRLAGFCSVGECRQYRPKHGAQVGEHAKLILIQQAVAWRVR